METYPPEAPAAHAALLDAVATMLDAVAEKRRQEHALDRQLRGTRIQLQALMVPLSAALGMLPEGQREAPRARLAAIEAEYGSAPHRLGTTPISEALIGYLACREAETVTASEAQQWLARAGHAPRRRYAALALARLQGFGVVTRQRYGTYAIHRLHPELVARRMKVGKGEPAGRQEAG